MIVWLKYTRRRSINNILMDLLINSCIKLFIMYVYSRRNPNLLGYKQSL